MQYTAAVLLLYCGRAQFIQLSHTNVNKMPPIGQRGACWVRATWTPSLSQNHLLASVHARHAFSYCQLQHHQQLQHVLKLDIVCGFASPTVLPSLLLPSSLLVAASETAVQTPMGNYDGKRAAHSRLAAASETAVRTPMGNSDGKRATTRRPCVF